MPVAFLKNDRSSPNFLFKKYTCLLVKDAECVNYLLVEVMTYAVPFKINNILPL